MTRISGGPSRLLQRQAARHTGWTRDRRTTFLTTLATTSNVRMAAEAAGMATPGAYALRRRDPAFAALWATALEEGYRHLEGELLAQARGQVVVDDENPDTEELAAAPRPEHRIDPALGVKMLQLRDARVKLGMPAHAKFVRRSQEEVDAALIALCRGLTKADRAILLAAGQGALIEHEVAVDAIGAMPSDDDAPPALATGDEP